MMVLDGMISYISMPNWIVMLLLEVATIFIEVFLIVGYWKFREGKLRWFEIVILVAIANVITAIMGLATVGISEDHIYSSSEIRTAFTSIIIIMIIDAIILFYITKRKKEIP